MHVYIACARERVERARAVALALERAGHSIVSRWHLGTGPVPSPRDAEEARDLALCDARDMGYAAALVALTEVDRGVRVGGDELVEIGMAYSKGLPIVWSSERDPAATLPVFYAEHSHEVPRDVDIVQAFRMLDRGGSPRPMRQRPLSFG
jgi:hypothetical protein